MTNHHKIKINAYQVDDIKKWFSSYVQSFKHGNQATETVIEDLTNSQIVNIKHVKTLNDFKLLQAGWIFDINFDATFSAVRSRRYLDMIFQALPDSDKIQELFKLIQIYLTEKIEKAKK
jgi:hypothetical protein